MINIDEITEIIGQITERRFFFLLPSLNNHSNDLIIGLIWQFLN